LASSVYTFIYSRMAVEVHVDHDRGEICGATSHGRKCVFECPATL